jgi:hypothetical protein
VARGALSAGLIAAASACSQALRMSVWRIWELTCFVMTVRK